MAKQWVKVFKFKLNVSSNFTEHAALLVGSRKTVDSAGKVGYQVLMKNSWGKSWSSDGYAWVKLVDGVSLVHLHDDVYKLKLHLEKESPDEPVQSGSK
jgi:C1A family cysteine protease